MSDAQEFKTSLQARIRARVDGLRRNDRLTQADVAHRLSLTQPRLSALLNGRLHLFSLEALIDIAAGLGLRVRMGIVRAYRR